MGTSTLAVLRARLKESLGDYNAFTCTTAGEAAGATLISTALKELAEDDNAFRAWYVKVTGGTAALGDNRRVKGTSGFTQSTGTITPSRAFTGQVESTATFEIGRFNNDELEDAINRAIEALYPHLYLPVRDETLSVDNRLSNGHFNTFSAGFTGWTEVNSPTVTQETTIARLGASAAKIVAGAGAAGQLTQTPTINVNEITDKTAYLRAWVYATAASKGRIRIDWDGGTTYSNSDYHTGADQWERLELDADVPAAATQVKAIMEAAASATVYFDDASLVIGPMYRYTIPTSIVSLRRVTQQYDADNPVGPFYPVSTSYPLVRNRVLRLEGIAPLSRPTTEAGTTEVDGVRVNLIVARAVEWFAELQATRTDEGRWGQRAQASAILVARLLAQGGVRMPPQGAQSPLDGYGTPIWHVERDGTTEYLVFDQAR